MIVLLKNSFINEIIAIGFFNPECPPAPAVTNTKPSTLASAAFSACLFLIIS